MIWPVFKGALTFSLVSSYNDVQRLAMQKDEKERGNGQNGDEENDRRDEEEWSKKDKKPTPDSNPANDKTKKK